MTAAPVSERYHGLDALRGFAMFLGILLHAAIPYMAHPIPFWPVRDPAGSIGFDVCQFAVHDFRMQLFFLLAGFFGALVYARRGLWGTVRHRAIRIGVPFLLAMITIQPLLQAVSVYAMVAQYRSDPDVPPELGAFLDRLPLDVSPAEAVQVHFTSGAFLGLLTPAHLWFLWYLLLCFAVMLPAAMIADRLAGLHQQSDRLLGWLLTSRLRWLLLAVPTWALLLPMTSAAGPDTPLSPTPNLAILAYYLFFFAIGWMLYRQRVHLPAFVRGWPLALVAAHGVILPLGIVFLVQSRETDDLFSSARIGMHAALALYTWLLIGGLTGLFLRYAARPRAWVRWMADASYWCYVASLPPIVMFQFLVASWPVAGIVKFVAVSAATSVVLLVTYRWGVRYTAIGRLLNGPRGRVHST